MIERQFLVDITISFPRGESLEDWHYVGHLFIDVVEGETPDIDGKVREKINTWIEKNRLVHDCFDNSEDKDGGFFCTVCGTDNTEKRDKVLTLSRERGVNARARDIVPR